MDYRQFVRAIVQEKEKSSDETVRRLLREAVIFHINEAVTHLQIEDQNLPEYFTGRETETIALFVKQLRKRLSKLERRTVLADPDLFDLNEMSKRVSRMNFFRLTFHHPDIEKMDDSLKQQASMALENINKDTTDASRYKALVENVNKRDKALLMHLNNIEDIGDSDEIKELLNELDFTTRKIKEIANNLMASAITKHGEDFLTKTTEFWGALTESRLSKRFNK